jgi:hypothetical protein
VANKPGPYGPVAAEGVPPSEEELAQVTPRDLYPISDIRFVMKAVAQLETKVDRLIDDVKVQGTQFAGLTEQIHSTEKVVCDKIHAVDKTVHGFKMGTYIGGGILAAAAVVFWFIEGDRITAILKQSPPQTTAAPVSKQP